MAAEDARLSILLAEVAALQSIYDTTAAISLLTGEDGEVFAFADSLLSLRATLPPGYPTGEPVSLTLLHVTSLSRSATYALSERLRRDVSIYCSEAADNEYLMMIIQRARELAEEQTAEQATTITADVTACTTIDEGHYQLVAFVWFHHIMSDRKKETILRLAVDYGVSGAVKFGFPGALYIQGAEAAVNAYLADLKRLRWQAMVVRDSQRVFTSGGASANALIPETPSALLPSSGLIAFGGDEMDSFAALMRRIGQGTAFKSAILRIG